MADRTVSGYGDNGAAKLMQDRKSQDIVERCIRGFSEKQAYRTQFALQWEQVASLIMPTQRNTFFFGNYTYPGTIKTQLQVDATGMIANAKFAAIVDSMMTPFSSNWHVLEADNEYVQKDRNCRLWLERASNKLMARRYAAHSGFRRQNQGVYQSTGAFGNGPLFIDRLYDTLSRPTRGTRYRGIPVGEMFIGENHQGIVDCYDRWFRFTPRQSAQAFDDIPEGLRSAMERNSEAPFDFLHCVYPNDEYDPDRIDAEGMMFRSHYISLTGKMLLTQKGNPTPHGGYRTFPVAYCRYMQGPGEAYGRGWAMDALPALKTLNAEKTTFLKQGHRAADPVLLMADDGAATFSLRPGAMNPGMMNQDGKPLVGIVPSGDIQITREMMDDERLMIGEASLTTLFQSLVENPNMTATQVVELINQKGIFLAPMAGSMAPDYLGALIDRELDLLIDDDPQFLKEMPPLLREAKGEYKVVYTSPLFRAARAGDAAGFLRTVESALQVASQMQDPSVLDVFSNERAWPAIASIQSVPESWMASSDEIAQKRKARSDAQAQQAQVQALPAQAAMLKAKAAVQKAGGQTADQMQQAA